VSGLILHLSILQSPVFLLNSRLGHFSATHLRGRPFSRSYRTNLPSSLAVIHSSSLEFSSQLPVSVCGTAIVKLLLSGFSRQSDYLHYQSPRRVLVLSRSARSAYFTTNPIPTRFNELFRQFAVVSLLCPRFAFNASIGILTDFPSAAPFGSRLRCRLTLL
jgi:hypothetical protein